MIAGSINDNVNALFALNSLDATASKSGTLEKELSSGSKINSPADDPAGFIAGQGFTTQINGVEQATSNANQAISLLETANGAVEQQLDILQQIRTIATQAANGINTASQLSSLQQVVSELQDQVTTISKQTQFNDENLLDGTFQGVQFQVGPNEGQTLSLSIQDTGANALGVFESEAATGAGAVFAANGSAAGGVNDQSGRSFAITALGAGAFTTGAIGVSGSTGSTSFSVSSATESAKDIAATVNGVQSDTGVSAVADTSAAFNVTSGSFSFTLGNGNGASATNPVNISATVTNISQSGLQPLVDAINQFTQTTGVTASVNGSNQLVLTNSEGDNISISNFSGTGTLAAGGTSTVTLASAGTTSATVQGVVTLESTQSFALSAAAGNIGLGTSSSHTSVSSVNVGTVEGANAALNVIDFALQSLQKVGGTLGAVEKRIEALLNNLQSTDVNLTSARSVVEDANIPKVTSDLSQAQILQQAGVFALAQSNTLQQSFLRLLQ